MYKRTLFEAKLDITALDWARLSPLVDEALDLAPSKRREWLRDNAAAQRLSPAQREQLEALIVQSDAPETDSIFATLPVLTRAPRSETSFSADDTVRPYVGSVACKARRRRIRARSCA
jgi:hypothetical protein